jgi:hypothetical protein
MNKSTNLRILALLRACRKKAKKGRDNRMKICAASTRQNGGKLNKKTRNQNSSRVPM